MFKNHIKEKDMKYTKAFIVAAWCCSFLSSVAGIMAQDKQLATIKRKHGQQIEGEIKGVIVQKETIKEWTEGSKKHYNVIYYLTNGSDIRAIDEKGVHVPEGTQIPTRFVTQKGKPPDDLEVLQVAEDKKSLIPTTKAGGQVLRAGVAATGVSAAMLLGELRTKDGKTGLIGALEIQTTSGLIAIPVGEIIDFTQKEK
jgi:hypothetical protein